MAAGSDPREAGIAIGADGQSPMRFMQAGRRA
jgi:hypothetical protein